MKKIVIAILSIITFVCCVGLIACNNKQQTAQTLSAPTLSEEDYLLKWNVIDNANGYIVRINGDDYSANTTTYSLQGWKDGEYLCLVKAVGDGVNYLDSAFSTPITVVKKPVVIDEQAPQISVTNAQITVSPKSKVDYPMI